MAYYVFFRFSELVIPSSMLLSIRGRNPRSFTSGQHDRGPCVSVIHIPFALLRTCGNISSFPGV